MIVDSLLELSLNQAVTATAVSINTVDLRTARDMAPGEDIFAVFDVDQTVTAAGAATVALEIISSAAADLSSPTVLVSTMPIPRTELTAGRRPISLRLTDTILLAMPLGQRFLGVRYTVATGPLTAGRFTCYLTNAAPSVGKNYPSGFSVF